MFILELVLCIHSYVSSYVSGTLHAYNLDKPFVPALLFTQLVCRPTRAKPPCYDIHLAFLCELFYYQQEYTHPISCMAIPSSRIAFDRPQNLQTESALGIHDSMTLTELYLGFRY